MTSVIKAVHAMPPRIVLRSRSLSPEPPSSVHRLVSRRNALLAVLCLIIVCSLNLLHARPDDDPSLRQLEQVQQYPQVAFIAGDMWAHNDAVASRLARCRELGMLQDTSDPIPQHARLSDAEERRYQAYGCGTNETTVILIAEDSFVRALRGDVRGEDIWAMSTMAALQAHGYAFIFSSMGAWRPEVDRTVELYAKYRENIRMVIMDPEQTASCYGKQSQICLRSEGNDAGIDDWRILTFWYWDDAPNPLGPRFTLSPSAHSTHNRLLPLSIELTCVKKSVLPQSQRREQAYLLGKQLDYFSPSFNFTWTLPGLAAISEAEQVSFVAGIGGDENAALWTDISDAGINNLGLLSQEQFHDELGHSKVLVGIGKPRTSPSPWDALCMGVPFINPVMRWDEADPADETRWLQQQWRMADMKPPYVYSVYAHDLAGLQSAIRAALDNPIERYIPDHMRFDYVKDKVAELVEWDWREEARVAKLEMGLGS